MSRDADQAIQDCYDPVQNALRLNYTQTKLPVGGKIDASQVIKQIYIPSIHALAIDSPGETSGDLGAKLDFDQIIKMCLDAATGKLRVVSVASTGQYNANGYFPKRYFAPAYFIGESE